MLTRRDAFKLGFGAALCALFGKFVPKAKTAAPLALGIDLISDPYCPEGTAYIFSGKKPLLSELMVYQIRNLRDTSPTITRLLVEGHESANS